MSVFAIADLHLSLGTDKPMDIFNGWNNYVERLEKNWRAIVKPTDTVVIIGDISWAMRLNEAEADFRFIHNLPGRKLILKGNHDYWWITRKKIEDFFKRKGFDSIEIVFNSAALAENIAVCGTRGWFYDCGASEADIKVLNREVGRLNASIDAAVKLDGEPIVFIHYPPVYADFECDEIMQTLIQRGIKKCYYGHIHGTTAARKAVIGEYKGIKFTLVSCDYTEFFPVLIR